MSELKEAIIEAERHPKPATVREWFASLEDEDRQALTETILSRQVSIAQLHRILVSLDGNPAPFKLTAFKDFAREIREETNE